MTALNSYLIDKIMHYYWKNEFENWKNNLQNTLDKFNQTKICNEDNNDLHSIVINDINYVYACTPFVSGDKIIRLTGIHHTVTNSPDFISFQQPAPWSSS